MLVVLLVVLRHHLSSSFLLRYCEWLTGWLVERLVILMGASVTRGALQQNVNIQGAISPYATIPWFIGVSISSIANALESILGGTPPLHFGRGVEGRVRGCVNVVVFVERRRRRCSYCYSCGYQGVNVSVTD